VVRDFQCGFTANVNNYIDGWDIKFNTSFSTVDETISNNLPLASGTVAGGGGIYEGSGTVPSTTNVTLTNSLNFDSGTLYIDGANNRVGIGTTTPNKTLTVSGEFEVLDDSYLLDIIKKGKSFLQVNAGQSSSFTQGIPLNTNSVNRVKVTVVGVSNGAGAAFSADYILTFRVNNSFPATVTQVGTTLTTGLHRTETPLNATFSVSGTNLIVSVSGAQFVTTRWSYFYENTIRTY
jgi:hypothetical protein